MKSMLSKQLVLCTIVVLLVSASSSPVASQEGRPSLSELGFNFNFTFGFDGEQESILDVQATSDGIFLVGYVDYDISEESSGEGRNIITKCEPKSPFFMQGEFAQTTSNCAKNGLIIKLDLAGNVEWASFFGGELDDVYHNVIVDQQGGILAIGTSNSPGLSTSGAIDSEVDEIQDLIISKYNQSGGIDWSTYLGGQLTESIYDVLIDSEDNIIIVGSTKSLDFPIKDAFDTEIENTNQYTRMESFITKLTPQGDILWSTYFGGSNIDIANGVALDNDDNLIIAGITRSLDFPVKNAEDMEHNGLIDVYLSKIDKNGNLVKSGYIGGRYLDIIRDMKITDDNEIIIVGQTNSENFPMVNASDVLLNSNEENTVYSDTLIVKFTLDGDILYSTYLGGDGTDGGNTIEILNSGNFIVSGYTQSTDFPTRGIDGPLGLNKNTYYKNGDQPADAFLSIFNKDGRFGHSFFFGGQGVESVISTSLYNGEIFITGETSSADGYDELANTNPFSPGSLYIANINIPQEISFKSKPINNYANYNGTTPAYQSVINDDEPLLDTYSYGIIGILVSYPLGRFVFKKLKAYKFRSNLEQRNEINSYLDRIRNDGEQ